jgi:3-oxoadipate enol-lactonase
MPHRPTLLLLHGFPQDSSLWHGTAAALSDVANVLTPDLRGFGDDRRALPAAMSMEACADDIKVLLDARGIDGVVLGGLSMGGYVALAFAERWPGRIAGLLLCNTRATADTEEGKVAREETARNAFDKGVPVIARGMLPKLLSARTKRERPDLVATVEMMMARQRPEAVAAAARGMALRPDRTPMLASITAPTLIVTGDQDELMPLPTSEAMHHAIHGSELVVLPDVGHLSPVEAPEAFQAAVRRFITSLPHA